jgi:hypothetical protein
MMQVFLKKLLSFLVIPFAISLVIGFVIIFYQSPSVNYTLGDGITAIFLGDSHIRCSVNDSLMPDRKNVSGNSESLYFSYYKLIKLLDENPNIKTIYLGFSYHSLSNYYDDFITGHFSRSVSPVYFYTLPSKERLKMLYWNWGNFFSYVKELLTICYQNILKKSVSDFTGGYSNMFTSTMAIDTSMDKRINFQYYSKNKLNNFSEINLIYFYKILNLCKAKHIQLVILKTPLHPYYEKRVPAEYVSKYNEIVSENKLKIIDFDNITFNDSCFLPDGEHLSVKGADQVTRALL